MDSSTLLGISISDSILKTISSDSGIQNEYSFRQTIKILTLHQTSSMLLRKIYYLNQNSYSKNIIIIVKNLIIKNDHWSSKASNSIKYARITNNLNKSKISVDSYINTMNQGSPSSIESDACLAELLSLNQCSISTSCLNIMDEKRISSGYHLTHKLLYYIVVQNRGCINVFAKSFSTLTRYFCQEINKEISAYMTLSFHFRLRDIFLEQVFFCAYLGFSEFLRKDWINMILEWQDPEGRFIHFGDKFDSHINGLAVAFLTVVGKIVKL